MQAGIWIGLQMGGRTTVKDSSRQQHPNAVPGQRVAEDEGDVHPGEGGAADEGHVGWRLGKHPRWADGVADPGPRLGSRDAAMVVLLALVGVATVGCVVLIASNVL